MLDQYFESALVPMLGAPPRLVVEHRAGPCLFDRSVESELSALGDIVVLRPEYSTYRSMPEAEEVLHGLLTGAFIVNKDATHQTFYLTVDWYDRSRSVLDDLEEEIRVQRARGDKEPIDAALLQKCRKGLCRTARNLRPEHDSVAVLGGGALYSSDDHLIHRIADIRKD
jgi:hypothetical protein